MAGAVTVAVREGVRVDVRVNVGVLLRVIDGVIVGTVPVGVNEGVTGMGVYVKVEFGVGEALAVTEAVDVEDGVPVTWRGGAAIAGSTRTNATRRESHSETAANRVFIGCIGDPLEEIS